MMSVIVSTDGRSALPRQRRIRRLSGDHRLTSRPRALHLIDLENLLGTQRDAAAVADVWSEYVDTVGIGVADSVLVGTETAWSARAWFALPEHGLRRVCGKGPDAADRALLAAVDIDHDLARFPTLVIASGDQAFAPLARAARARGCRVELVIGAGFPNWSLANAATAIHCLASRTVQAA
jgi:hypothetical protein